MATELLVKKRIKSAKLPTRAHPNDAGLDIYLSESIELEKDKVLLVDTGLAIALPKNTVGLVFSRSSYASKYVTLGNSVGVIDAGYRGALKIPLIYRPPVGAPNRLPIHKGERIAQLLVVPILTPEVKEVNELPELDSRGEGGFGSTGA